MEHKARSLVTSVVVFMLLLVPLRFPAYFWYIVAAANLGILAGLFWTYGERPTITRFKEDWFSILFNAVFLTVAASFSYSVANPFVQALLLGAIAFAIYFSILGASRLKRGYTPSLLIRNIISLVALLGIFMAVADVLRWSLVSAAPYTSSFALFLVFSAVFVISEFLFEIQGIEKSVLYSLVLSFGITQVVWISSYWLVSYPQSARITNLGVPLPSILSAIFFYLFWGISQHRLEGTLTRRVIWEYVLISTFFIAILFSTTQWLPE